MKYETVNNDRREFLEAVFSSLDQGVVIFRFENGRFKIYEFNEKAWKICGFYSRNDMLDLLRTVGITEIVEGSERKQFVEALTECVAGAEKRMKVRIIRKDSSLRLLSIHAKGIELPENGRGVMLLFNDETDIKRRNMKEYYEAYSKIYDMVAEIDNTQNVCTIAMSRNGTESVGVFRDFVNKHCKRTSDNLNEKKLRSLLDLSDSQKGFPRTAEVCFVDSNKNKTWYFMLLLDCGEGMYLLCSKDVTEKMNAQSLVLEMKSTSSQLNKLSRKAVLEELITDMPGVLTFEYDTGRDVFYLNDGKQIKCIDSFIENMYNRTTVAAYCRKKLCDCFDEVVTKRVKGVVEFDAGCNSGDFKSYRMELLPVCDTNGDVNSVCGLIALSHHFDDHDEPQSAEVPQVIMPDSADGSECANLYIIDAKTYEVMYFNKRGAAEMGEPLKGETCYNAFEKRNSPCEKCPILMLKKYNVSMPVQVTSNGKEFILQASFCTYRGHKAYSISAVDVGSFSHGKERVREMALERRLKDYASAFGTIYDDIFLVNFKQNKYKVVLSSCCSSDCGKWFRIGVDSRMWTEKYVHPSDRSAFSKFMTVSNIRGTISTGRAPQINYRCNYESEIRWRKTVVVHFEADYYLGLGRDISLEKSFDVTGELADASKQFSFGRSLIFRVFDCLDCAAFIWDYRKKQLIMNDKCDKYELSRYNLNSVTSEPLERNFVHPEDYLIAGEMYRQIAIGAEKSDTVVRVKMTDGSFRFTNISCTVICGQDNVKQLCILTFTDVDENVQLWKMYDKLNESWQIVTSKLPVGVASLTVEDGKIIPRFVNEKTCEIFGFTKAEYDIRVANQEQAFSTPYLDSIQKFIGNPLANGGTFDNPDLQLRRKDGTVLHLHAVAQSVQKPGGEISLYAAFVEVRNDRKTPNSQT